MTMKTNKMTEKTDFEKKLKPGAAVLLLACLIAVTSAGMALAGGLLNHKTKVTNNSDYDVTVTFTSMTDTIEQRISKKSSHTFDSGTKCPLGLEGYVHGLDMKMITRCIKGPEQGVSPARSNCETFSCRSSNWAVKKHSSGVYHFDEE